jgi:hypothetical protein
VRSSGSRGRRSSPTDRRRWRLRRAIRRFADRLQNGRPRCLIRLAGVTPLATFRFSDSGGRNPQLAIASSRSERVQHGLGATAFVLAPVGARPSQWRPSAIPRPAGASCTRASTGSPAPSAGVMRRYVSRSQPGQRRRARSGRDPRVSAEAATHRARRPQPVPSSCLGTSESASRRFRSAGERHSRRAERARCCSSTLTVLVDGYGDAAPPRQ